MIHIDVSYNQSKQQYLVETSADGGPWRTQYFVDIEYEEMIGLESLRNTESRARHKAEKIARIMGYAWSYAGIEWRGTSCGYKL